MLKFGAACEHVEYGMFNNSLLAGLVEVAIQAKRSGEAFQVPGPVWVMRLLVPVPWFDLPHGPRSINPQGVHRASSLTFRKAKSIVAL